MWKLFPSFLQKPTEINREENSKRNLRRTHTPEPEIGIFPFVLLLDHSRETHLFHTQGTRRLFLVQFCHPSPVYQTMLTNNLATLPSLCYDLEIPTLTTFPSLRWSNPHLSNPKQLLIQHMLSTDSFWFRFGGLVCLKVCLSSPAMLLHLIKDTISTYKPCPAVIREMYLV